MNMFFTEEERIKEVIIEGDAFRILALLPSDRIAISRATASSQLGIPAQSFAFMERKAMEDYAMISLAVKGHPEWWSGPENCPIEDILYKLTEEIEKWSAEFQEILKKNKRIRGGPKA